MANSTFDPLAAAIARRCHIGTVLPVLFSRAHRMKEVSDDRMHTSIAIGRDERAKRPDVNLGALADQLNAIAAELRGDESIGLRLLRGHGKEIDQAARQRMARSPFQTDVQSDLSRRRAVHAQFAREAYATRRRRANIFGTAELFGEPAWDILLDLYIAHVDNKPVSVSSACIGSAAPPTTGLRWLGVLAEQDLILREHDPEDQRRVLVRLTERGLTAMDEYFASAGLSA